MKAFLTIAGLIFMVITGAGLLVSGIFFVISFIEGTVEFTRVFGWAFIACGVGFPGGFCMVLGGRTKEEG